MAVKGSTDRTNSPNRTSQSLIGLVKAQDSAAWERLVQLYSPMVYFWCQHSGLPGQEIPDVFQEVFHSVARNIHKFRHEKNGTFRGWLRTLTRNKVIDHYRKSGRNPLPVGGTAGKLMFDQIPSSTIAEPPESGHDEAVPNDAERSVQRQLLHTALSNIRPHFQENTWKAFWLVTIDGRETCDVATELSMQPGTIRVAKSRVLKRLRQEFGDSID